MLLSAKERGYSEVESLLQQAMQKRFSYSPEFELLKDSIIARDRRKIGVVLRRKPILAQRSDALGNNALHWSVITRQLHLIEHFVDLGTPIDAQRADGRTPVLLAVGGASDYWYRATRAPSHPSLRNASVLVGSLLAHGASYNISVSAAVGDQERVEQLLRKDVSLAKRLDPARVSPLSYAAREGHLHIVQFLLERGANPNTPEDLAPHGRALFEACCANHLEVAQLLLEHGANPNAGLDSSGCCLTIGKVYHGDRAKPLQKLLRQHRAYTPPYTMSVLQMKQAIHNNSEVVRHEEFLGNVLRKRSGSLLDLCLDSDPTVPDRLDYRDVLNYPRPAALVSKLLARGLDPNRPNCLGRTLLHACAEIGDQTTSAILLDAGADINARDLEFKATPLAAAARKYGDADPKHAERSRKLIEFLLKRGAATNLPGDEPWATPLQWATRHGQDEIVDLLKQHGAT